MSEDAPEPETRPESEEAQPESEVQPESEETQPESEETQPESAEAQPEPAEAQPESGEAQSETGEAQPESAEAQPEPAEAQPEPAEAQLESTEAQPEPAEAQPEPAEAQPESTEEQPQSEEARDGGEEAPPETEESPPTDLETQEPQDNVAAFTEEESQTEYSFEPNVSDTTVAKQLLASVQARKAEGEKDKEEGLDEELEDWLLAPTKMLPPEPKPMWSYNLRVPSTMVPEQFDDLTLALSQLKCEPMWDFDLLASASMIEPQDDDTGEIKLDISELKCEPMWDYELSVSQSFAEVQMFLEGDEKMKLELDSVKCRPMWDYDLSAPLKELGETIFWIPSFMNFQSVTREKFFRIEETPNTKFVQTNLHFDPYDTINLEDLLSDENEEMLEKKVCEPCPETEIIYSGVSDEEWFLEYLSFCGKKGIPYQLVGEKCVVTEEFEQFVDKEDAEVSTEVQTDVALGELLESESIASEPEATDVAPGEQVESSVPEGTDDAQEELLESESKATVPEGTDDVPGEQSETVTDEGQEETSDTEDDSVPWPMLKENESQTTQKQFLPTQEDIVSALSLAPNIAKKERKFNFAVVVDETQWGFPEYTTADDHEIYSTLAYKPDAEFTWIDDNTAFESTVFEPISPENQDLLMGISGESEEGLLQSGSQPFEIDDKLKPEGEEMEGDSSISTEGGETGEAVTGEDEEPANTDEEPANEDEEKTDNQPESTEDQSSDVSKDDGVTSRGQSQTLGSKLKMITIPDGVTDSGPVIELQLVMLKTPGSESVGTTAPKIEVEVQWEAASQKTTKISPQIILEDNTTDEAQTSKEPEIQLTPTSKQAAPRQGRSDFVDKFLIRLEEEIAPLRLQLREIQEKVIALNMPELSGVSKPDKPDI